jgi:hypothetical protein
VERHNDSGTIAHLRQRLAMRDLRIGQRLRDSPVGRAWNAVVVESSKTLPGGQRARPGLDAVHQIFPFVATIGVFGEARISQHDATRKCRELEFPGYSERASNLECEGREALSTLSGASLASPQTHC